MNFLIISNFKFIKFNFKNFIKKAVTCHKEHLRYPPVLLRREYQSSQNLLWIEPEGHDTGVYIYNSLSKSKVPFKTIHPKVVSWYNCGPTVYDSAHIGHALSFVKLDIIRRILEDVFQLNVVKVTGVTDVDDKIINRAREMNVSVKSLTEKYEKEFFNDMQKLNVLASSLTPRVTDYIPEIIAFVKNIEESGLAYSVGEGTIYFNTGAYGRYGKLVKQNEEELKQNVNMYAADKKSQRDFVLWKEAKESDTIYWDSPWGPGRPGWHIECSVMASKIFGQRLDLHTGGIDLLFPHHENEEAQCCAHHGCEQWCNYWLHTGHLHIKGLTKMSKSLQNTISVEEFLGNYSANVFRIFCLSTHYRSSVEYTKELMDSAVLSLQKIDAFFEDSLAYISGRSSACSLDEELILKKYFEVRADVVSSLADDFNTRRAMSLLFELISLCNKEMNNCGRTVQKGRSIGVLCAVRVYVQRLLSTLGLKLECQTSELTEADSLSRDETFVSVMESTLAFRQTVKKFALSKGSSPSSRESESREERERRRLERAPLLEACDALREDLNSAGISVKDYSRGTSWKFHKKKKEVT